MNDENKMVNGVFVPVVVLQHPALNPAMVYSWMLLRMSVGDQEESAPIGIQELVEYIGKSSSTLYDHLAALRRAELIRWRFEARGRKIFSFPEDYENLYDSRRVDSEQYVITENRNVGHPKDEIDPITDFHYENLDCSEKLDRNNGTHSRNLENNPIPSPENRNKELVDSRKLDCSENLDQKSGIHSRNLENDPSPSPENWNKNDHEGEKDPEIGVNSRKLDDNPAPSPENWNDALSLNPLINNININNKEVLREARFQKIGPDSKNLEREAVKAYRQTIGLRPNKTQRAAIGDQVRDLELWKATLEHWQAHRWNPKNIPGILELYARDGPEGCRFCRQKKPETGLEALAILRREYASGERG